MPNPTPSHGVVFNVHLFPAYSAATDEDGRMRRRWRRIPRTNASPLSGGLIGRIRDRLADAHRIAITRNNAPPNSAAAPDEDGLPRSARRRWRRISRDNVSPNSEEEETAVSGLSEEAISRFMQATVYEAEAAAGDQEVCVVCQENYGENQRVGALRCRHRFHAECIGKWLQIKNVCPLCNAVVWAV